MPSHRRVVNQPIGRRPLLVDASCHPSPASPSPSLFLCLWPGCCLFPSRGRLCCRCRHHHHITTFLIIPTYRYPLPLHVASRPPVAPAPPPPISVAIPFRRPLPAARCLPSLAMASPPSVHGCPLLPITDVLPTPHPLLSPVVIIAPIAHLPPSIAVVSPTFKSSCLSPSPSSSTLFFHQRMGFAGVFKRVQAADVFGGDVGDGGAGGPLDCDALSAGCRRGV